jgi:hypothetical protein
MIREICESIKLLYKEMHFIILKLIYMCYETLHVLAKHVSIFRDVKDKVYILYKSKMKL